MPNSKIWLSSPHMSGGEMEYIRQAYESNWIAPLGPFVDGFEHDLADYTGAGHVAALSSGTAALHLALILLGIKPGDRVICSTFTFSASVNPILYQGATPVFVDSESESWNMDAEMLEKAIIASSEKGQDPRAIIPVHLYGMPADMDRLMAVADRYGIPVIEDAAEALGATYNSRHPGTFGVMGVLSFNGNKIITTSGGGALMSDNKEFIERARFLSEQARDPAPHYQHSEIGYNYRLSNICAAIGRGQMRVLNERVARRREIFDLYRKELKKYPGIAFQPEPEGCVSNRWLTCVTIDPDQSHGLTREQVRLALQKENIDCRPLWKPMHQQPVFQAYPSFLNGVSDHLFEHGLCLPSGSNMTDQDMERIFACLHKMFR